MTRKSYLSDLTDDQWALLQPLVPPAKSGGTPRTVDIREVLNTLFYQARSGCQWDMLPHDLLPKSTVFDYLKRWEKDGTWQVFVDALRQKVRMQEGRDATPQVAYVDSQSVKTTEMGGERADDGGKKIQGRKRHFLVDSLGLLLVVAVTHAKWDDGTAAPLVLEKLTAAHTTRLERIWGDGRYHNRALTQWLQDNEVAYRVLVVSRPKDAEGFVLLAKRWVVERSIAWFNRYRRLSKDYEDSPRSSEAWIKVSAVSQMVRKLKPNAIHPTPPFRYPKPQRKVA